MFPGAYTNISSILQDFDVILDVIVVNVEGLILQDSLLSPITFGIGDSVKVLCREYHVYLIVYNFFYPKIRSYTMIILACSTMMVDCL